MGLPDAVETTIWLLEDTERLWAAALPVLLPLWPARLLMERIGWHSARFQGRFSAAFGAGVIARDFELAGVQVSDRWPLFAAGLEMVPAGPPGLWMAAVGGPRGARMAARVGIGIVADTFATDATAKAMFATVIGASPTTSSMRCGIQSSRAWNGSPSAAGTGTPSAIGVSSRCGPSSPPS